MPVDMSKSELEGMGFRSMNENRCECDCMKGTCTDCFIRGKMKPWCSNCHSDFNDGKCGCDNPSKPYVKKGWVDVTPHIVKHNEEQKKEIYKRIDAHNKMLERATRTYDTIWEGKICRDCGKSFKVRGGKIDTCKACTTALLNDGDKYSEDN